jgi:hypothetical protein
MTSICVRVKQLSACSGVSTIGSFSLKLVLSSMGTPLICANSERADGIARSSSRSPFAIARFHRRA